MRIRNFLKLRNRYNFFPCIRTFSLWWFYLILQIYRQHFSWSITAQIDITYVWYLMGWGLVTYYVYNFSGHIHILITHLHIFDITKTGDKKSSTFMNSSELPKIYQIYWTDTVWGIAKWLKNQNILFNFRTLNENLSFQSLL